jgi:hypothetical protein
MINFIWNIDKLANPYLFTSKVTSLVIIKLIIFKVLLAEFVFRVKKILSTGLFVVFFILLRSSFFNVTFSLTHSSEKPIIFAENR